jgi:site-specific recombinase XerD
VTSEPEKRAGGLVKAGSGTVMAPGVGQVVVPIVIAASGEDIANRFIEFFVVAIRNVNTRRSYATAIRQFCAWLEQQGARELTAVQPVHVATYIEALGARLTRPSVNLHLAAIKRFFTFLVTGGVLRRSPAVEVKVPTFSRREGATPVTSAENVRRLLESLPTETVIGLRDRALIGTMLFTTARIGAALGCKVGDYYPDGFGRMLCLHEKGGKERRVPVHHQLVEYLETYLDAAGIRDERGTPLFRSTRGRSGQLTDRPLDPVNSWAIVQRRLRKAGIAVPLSNHSFRAMGLTAYIENGGDLEGAQDLANHADARTTRLHIRQERKITLSAIERIRF